MVLRQRAGLLLGTSVTLALFAAILTKIMQNWGGQGAQGSSPGEGQFFEKNWRLGRPRRLVAARAGLPAGDAAKVGATKAAYQLVGQAGARRRRLGPPASDAAQVITTNQRGDRGITASEV